MPNRTTICYNLILMLFDQMKGEYGYKGLDDPDFVAYVTEETGMNPTQYHSIVGV